MKQKQGILSMDLQTSAIAYKPKAGVLRRFMLIVFFFIGIASVCAQSYEKEKDKLQAEMYKYFSTPEQEKFMEVTEQLKEKSHAAGDEQTFYRAWGNQAIYLSIHEQRTEAKEAVSKMKKYARKHKSHFGEYTALHVQGSVYLRMHDYDGAENSFKEAIELLHANCPGESAAADYLELVAVANRKNNAAKGREYGEMALKEPNLQPQHKIRVLSMLCQYLYREGNRKRFNELYDEWKELLRQTSGGSLEATVETEYLIINGHYQEALKACGQVPLKTQGSLRAQIYHLMGDDAAAYGHLRQWINVKDSISREDEANVFSDYIVQAQNERLENERLRLESENKTLRSRMYITFAIAVIVVAAILIYKRQKTVKNLREDNRHLDDERKKAEKAHDEAQKALDLKREFLYNISQELRTPLNPITGMSDLLADDEYHFQHDERAAMSNHIKENSKLLTKMVDNMIELSFYESKVSLPMDPPISPNIICRHMVDTLRNGCPEGLQVLFDTSISNSVLVKTNVECVEKVIKHLVNNAFEHTKKGSITIRCGKRDNYVCIAVEDTGTGVAPEIADRILGVSLQKDSQFKTTGMGLSICQAILKLLNGRIYLDKEYKAGARFVFELEENSQETS